MKHVLIIINGKPLLDDLDEFDISESGYESICAINEVVRYDEEMEWFFVIGHYAHQVLQHSVQSLIESDSADLVKHIVKKFGLKNFFANAFSEMIDNLGEKNV